MELQALWICETQIQQIKGLENLAKLKELYLYSNKVQKIQGLDTLTSLEVSKVHKMFFVL